MGSSFSRAKVVVYEADAFSIKQVKGFVYGMTTALGKGIESGDINTHIDRQKFALALAEVGEYFSIMMSQLQSTTATRDDIDAIFYPMKEFIITLDFDHNIVCKLTRNA